MNCLAFSLPFSSRELQTSICSLHQYTLPVLTQARTFGEKASHGKSSLQTSGRPVNFLTHLKRNAILFLMRQHSIVLFVLLLLAGLAACSPGHVGSSEIAFLRDGHLWTIDPDGANAFDVAPNSTPVIGYGWSPNHQILVFRSLDSSFARSQTGKHLAINPITESPGDLPSGLNTIGIDGGEPIPIIFSAPATQHSNAWLS